MRQNFGRTLCLALVFLSLNSCRKSHPPHIEVCLGDGVGGADCVEADGTTRYRLPSELNNYWMTNQPDMQNFSSWCYDTNLKNAAMGMESIQTQIGR